MLQAFWDLLPNHSVSELPDKTCLHVFKDDIQPLWEDPKNLCGGHFKITAKTQPHSESMWLDVVMNLLGEQFPHRELVNGVSIMANKVGNNLVKIWIAVVKRPVVHALREFIRATLKDEDYFAEDVRLVPHKLVVKGAGKKIPGVTPEAAPESMATPPAASSTSPSIPSPSSRSPNPSPRHSHPTGSRSRRRSGNLPPPPTCANTPAPVPAVGGPATAMYPEPVIPCSSSHGDLCFETLSINGVPLSPTPSCAVSEVSYSSTPPTPRSVAGADCEVGCAKPFKAHRRTWSNESYGGCYSGLSTPHSIGGSEIDLFSDGNSPRSREDEDGGGDAGPVAPHHRPRGHRRTWSTETYAHNPYGPGLSPGGDGVEGAADSLLAPPMPGGCWAIPNPYPQHLSHWDARGAPAGAGRAPRPGHRRTWSTETYAFMDYPYTPVAGPIAEWQDSPAGDERSCNTETDSYRHDPYSLSASIVPISVTEPQ